jgi:4-hydroxy-3-methylbut-2-enyl diphosphate reductase
MPLHSFMPLQAFFPSTLQPPRPLQEFIPLQACFSPAPWEDDPLDAQPAMSAPPPTRPATAAMTRTPFVPFMTCTLSGRRVSPLSPHSLSRLPAPSPGAVRDGPNGDNIPLGSLPWIRSSGTSPGTGILPTVRILLASPRGFCAGVDRAIEIVELALSIYGRPVYVRHEIVHNRHVVDRLRGMGAVFVDDVAEIPEGAVVVFSAHGVSPKVREEAEARHLRAIDATCPLVTKVHLEARRHAAAGREILLIGHAGHVEVEGTMGEAPLRMRLVESVEDAGTIEVRDPAKVAFLTQTTLSVDDTRAIIDVLRRRFPAIQGPPQEDICYATQNRQNAVKGLARDIEVLLVVGAPNSSNSQRLVEVARAGGVRAHLVEEAADIDPAWVAGAASVGVTAGASAPEGLVRSIVERLRTLGGAEPVEVPTVVEDVHFALPPEVVRRP